MEAKETVMGKNQTIALSEEGSLITPVLWEFLEKVKEAQAEISFKAGQEEERSKLIYAKYKRSYQDGKLAGIKEVVELTIKLGFIPGHHDEWRGLGLHGRWRCEKDCLLCKWEARLKEWGL